MKTLLLIVFFFINYLFAYAQSKAMATFKASVAIIEPIGITNKTDLNFAAVDAGAGGVVVITPHNERLSSGGVKLTEGIKATAASFIVTGQKGFSFNLTLPQGNYLLSNGKQNIVLKDFTSSLVSTGKLSSGISEFNIGATIEVQPGQTPGIYRSLGSLPVTVHYN